MKTEALNASEIVWVRLGSPHLGVAMLGVTNLDIMLSDVRSASVGKHYKTLRDGMHARRASAQTVWACLIGHVFGFKTSVSP